jgi:hypothetical protein
MAVSQELYESTQFSRTAAPEFGREFHRKVKKRCLLDA